MFSIRPPLTEQSQVLSELAVFYHWIVVTIIHTNSPHYLSQVSELVRRIQKLKPLLTMKTAPVNTSDIPNVKQNLNDVKISKTTMVVLYCTVEDAKVLLNQAENHNLFDGKMEWLLTDSLTEDTSLLPWIPVGILGMRLHTMNESSFIEDLVYDTVIVTAHAQVVNLKNGPVANGAILPNCYKASVNGSIKPVFTRYD